VTSFARAKTLAITIVGATIMTTATPVLAPAGPRIVNGLDTQGFPTTGALLYSGGAAISESNAGVQCSGTLIGCETFLTAAHCVVEDVLPSHYWVYLHNGGIHQVSSITYHPGYDGNLSGRDVAIVKLTDPVTGIDPTTINTTHDLDALGTGLDGTIVGFGRTGGGTDYGVKRYGAIVTTDCNTGETAGEGNDKLVCWDYDASVGAPGEDSNTCNGDSGGPLFMTFSGATEIVGVTSAGVTLDCLPTDHSWDASVYYNASWISGMIGADSTASCGSIPPVGDPDVSAFHNSGSLSTLNPSDSFTINFAGTASVIRFTLNGTDNGSFNPNFFVKEGLGASAADYDCKADGTTVFGACEFVSPASGTWSVFVERAAGGGQYQVTTTVFGGDPPVCGNNLVEYAEECDGTSDDECPGLCAACACPAPVCGNDTLEAGEECDGSDDNACPGECSGCACPTPCTTGPLYGVKIVSDDRRLSYKAWLFDNGGLYDDLDPRDGAFTLEIVDGADTVDLNIPTADVGWIKADPERRRYLWKGDGTLDGLRRVKLTYRDSDFNPYWIVTVKGREVPGAAAIQVENILDFTLGFDGTCHLESW